MIGPPHSKSVDDALDVSYDPNSPVSFDLPCWRCGYNLRSLNPIGRCVECFAPISLSYHAGLLRFLEQRKLRRIRWGLRLLAIGLLAVVGFLSVPIICASLSFFSLSMKTPRVVITVLGLWYAWLVPFVGFLCVLVGVCVAVPNHRSDPLATRSRAWAAIVLVSVLGFIASSFAQSLLVWRYWDTQNALFCLHMAAIGMGVFEVVRVVAVRASNKLSARRLRILQIAFALAMLAHSAGVVIDGLLAWQTVVAPGQSGTLRLPGLRGGAMYYPPAYLFLMVRSLLMLGTIAMFALLIVPFARVMRAVSKAIAGCRVC